MATVLDRVGGFGRVAAQRTGRIKHSTSSRLRQTRRSRWLKRVVFAAELANDRSMFCWVESGQVIRFDPHSKGQQQIVRITTI